MLPVTDVTEKEFRRAISPLFAMESARTLAFQGTNPNKIKVNLINF